MIWPVSEADVARARAEVERHLAPTPLRRYPSLDRRVGHDVEVWVKHENHQPTNAFKVRNAIGALTALSEEQRARGIVGATRGNHGQGLAWAGRKLGIPVTICVPEGNSPSKNQAMVDLGATLVVDGRDYDESVSVASQLVAQKGLHMVHSTNDKTILAGATTITQEMLEQQPELDAIVVAVGGGSQCVGALTATRDRKDIDVYAVQAEEASAIHDGWHAGKPLERDSANTFADGLATRKCYEMTFGALQQGLKDFVTVSELELGAAVTDYLATTKNLAEGAGAAGLAGLKKLAPQLSGRRVGVILSGGNIDMDVLRDVLQA